MIYVPDVINAPFVKESPDKHGGQYISQHQQRHPVDCLQVQQASAVGQDIYLPHIGGRRHRLLGRARQDVLSRRMPVYTAVEHTAFEGRAQRIAVAVVRNMLNDKVNHVQAQGFGVLLHYSCTGHKRLQFSQSAYGEQTHDQQFNPFQIHCNVPK